MENDDGFVQIPEKHPLQWNNTRVALSPQRQTRWFNIDIPRRSVRSVFTSMSESRGGAGSLTLFLPLSFPSDPRRGGPLSSLPGVGGLGGGWYSPASNTSAQTWSLSGSQPKEEAHLLIRFFIHLTSLKEHRRSELWEMKHEVLICPHEATNMSEKKKDESLFFFPSLPVWDSGLWLGSMMGCSGC